MLYTSDIIKQILKTTIWSNTFAIIFLYFSFFFLSIFQFWEKFFFALKYWKFLSILLKIRGLRRRLLYKNERRSLKNAQKLRLFAKNHNFSIFLKKNSQKFTKNVIVLKRIHSIYIANYFNWWKQSLVYAFLEISEKL